MKNKSLFSQVITVFIVGIVCLLITLGLALLAGAVNTELFDFRNLNFSNMIPVLLIGGFISCLIIGIFVLFVGKTAFFKIHDYLKENNKTNGGNNK